LIKTAHWNNGAILTGGKKIWLKGRVLKLETFVREAAAEPMGKRKLPIDIIR
jgi:hypothetical protein